MGAGLVEAQAGTLGTSNAHNRQQMALIFGTSLSGHLVSGVGGKFRKYSNQKLRLNNQNLNTERKPNWTRFRPEFLNSLAKNPWALSLRKISTLIAWLYICLVLPYPRDYKNHLLGTQFGVVHLGRWLNKEGDTTAFGSALLFALRLHPFYAQIKLRIGDNSQLMDHLEQCAVIKAGSVEVGPFAKLFRRFWRNH